MGESIAYVECQMIMFLVVSQKFWSLHAEQITDTSFWEEQFFILINGQRE